jgi:hypothetical protein
MSHKKLPRERKKPMSKKDMIERIMSKSNNSVIIYQRELCEIEARNEILATCLPKARAAPPDGVEGLL